MPDPDPWAAFNPQAPTPGAANSLGRPIYRKPPPQPSPQTPAQAKKDVLEVRKVEKDLAQPDERYRPITAAERQSFGLDLKKPFVVNIKTGKPELISEGKDDDPAADPALAKSIKGLGIDEWLTNVSRARKQIDTGFATGMLGSIAGYFPGTPRKDFLGALEGIKGASILEKLQALREQSKTGASGMGSLTEQEGERLANSIASLSPDMSADELQTSLDIVERHAKALQAISAGKDPNDPAVQQEFGIMALPGAEPAKAALPPENPLAKGGGGDQGPQLTPSAGTTKSVIDPKKQALGESIVGLVAKGADRNTVMGYAVSVDPSLRSDPKFRAWVDQALTYRQQHPGAKFSIDPGFYTTEVPLARTDVGASGLDAAARNFADAGTAGNLGNITGLVGGDQDRAEQSLAAEQAVNPGASLAGQVAGGVTASMGGEALLARAGMAPGALRALLADSTYGATAGASNAEPGDRVNGGLRGLLLGAGGSIGGNLATRGLGSMLRGVTSPAVKAVADEGIPLTVGQAVGQSGRVGRVVKGVEDRLSGIPLVGDAVNARRLEGLQKMNVVAFDKALEPIGGNIGGKFGEEAVADAQDQVGKAFQSALAGKAATVDHDFIKEATPAKMALLNLPRVGNEVADSVDETINAYFNAANGSISGENMQSLLRDLGQIKRANAADPLGHRIGKAIDRVSDSVENLFRRQAPEVMPQYDAAKKAFRRLSTLEDAVLRAKNGSTDGNALFTTGQLGLADRANTVKFGGKHAAAAGKGEFHDFQRDAQEVLPNKVPDSGTAGRLFVPAAAAVALGGAGGYLEGNTGKGLTLGALIALAYSRGGQRALTGAVLKRPAVARAAGSAVQRKAPLLGHAAATQAALAAQRD